jgi:hypothetical protein
MLPPVMIYCAVCAPVVMVTGVIALAGTGAATTTAVRMAIIKTGQQPRRKANAQRLYGQQSGEERSVPLQRNT